MTKNQLNFLDCENKGWFKKLPVFTQERIAAQKSKVTYKEFGLNFNEYEYLKNLKKDEI